MSNPCKLTECRGKPLCQHCRAMQAREASSHLLPEGSEWGEPLTPGVVAEIAARATRAAQAVPVAWSLGDPRYVHRSNILPAHEFTPDAERADEWVPLYAAAPTPPAAAEAGLREALEAAHAWISSSPHGDNCYVSAHYPGDPGAGCNCGKESVETIIEEAIEALAAHRKGGGE